MEYLIISDIIRVNKDNYPVVFIAVKSGDGFRRITDIDLFFREVGGVSDIEESYQSNMEVFAIKRSASVKVTVSMFG